MKRARAEALQALNKVYKKTNYTDESEQTYAAAHCFFAMMSRDFITVL